MPQLDPFDHAILSILQSDSTLPYAEIGQRVNLSASAVLRRVQRMRDNGTIMATRAIISPEHVGLNLTIVVEVVLENEGAEWGGGATRLALVDDPCVLQCLFVTGETDLFLVVAAATMEHYKEFTERHFLNNASIRKFRTSVVMDRFKSTTQLPI